MLFNLWSKQNINHKTEEWAILKMYKISTLIFIVLHLNYLESYSLERECDSITLSACEVNACPKQSLNGLANSLVCQISCNSVGEDCSSWTYFADEKVKSFNNMDITVNHVNISILAVWTLFLSNFQMDNWVSRNWRDH